MIQFSSPIIQDTLELSKQLHQEAKTLWFTNIVKNSDLICHSKEPCLNSQIELKKKLSKIVINSNAWHTKINY